MPSIFKAIPPTSLAYLLYYKGSTHGTQRPNLPPHHGNLVCPIAPSWPEHELQSCTSATCLVHTLWWHCDLPPAVRYTSIHFKQLNLFSSCQQVAIEPPVDTSLLQLLWSPGSRLEMTVLDNLCSLVAAWRIPRVLDRLSSDLWGQHLEACCKADPTKTDDEPSEVGQNQTSSL